METLMHRIQKICFVFALSILGTSLPSPPHIFVLGPESKDLEFFSGKLWKLYLNSRYLILYTAMLALWICTSQNKGILIHSRLTLFLSSTRWSNVYFLQNTYNTKRDSISQKILLISENCLPKIFKYVISNFF